MSSVILPGATVPGAAQEATLQNIESTVATLGTESTLSSLDSKDFATETTLASLEGKDFSTETTLVAVSGIASAIETLVTSLNVVSSGIQTLLTTLNNKSAANLFTLQFDTVDLISATGTTDVYQSSYLGSGVQTLTITYSDATKVTPTKWEIS